MLALLQHCIFRVEHISDHCATLSLLIAFDKDRHILDFTDKDSVCDVFRLEKSKYCIEVDLDCFCAIECLNQDSSTVAANKKSVMGLFYVH